MHCPVPLPVQTGVAERLRISITATTSRRVTTTSRFVRRGHEPKALWLETIKLFRC